ncbi:MAG: deoxyribodipyrimidine photolyase, partial [Pirellulaceae bacterium]|nr:deoxyribodipyrimidine photolyase [Pirellulaceae bacterium]
MNQLAVQPDRRWVVYWMTAFRRTRSNYALQFARDLAKQFDRPLIVLEALRVGYRWASNRFHRFIIEGMLDNQAACSKSGVLYYPYVEPRSGDGSG